MRVALLLALSACGQGAPLGPQEMRLYDGLVYEWTQAADLPVPAPECAERLPGITVRYIPESYWSSPCTGPVVGCYRRSTDEIWIRTPDDWSGEVRWPQSATVAHELTHFLTDCSGIPQGDHTGPQWDLLSTLIFDEPTYD